jgi:DNA-3-methyladenine glycosylase
MAPLAPCEPPCLLLPRDFYLRSVEVVARDLLGRHLRLGPVTLRITEVEAYGGPEDSASHARSGRTARNAPMWEPGGLAYVYFCYGMHHMLNVVSGPADRAEAVLVRSCEIVEGLEVVLERRKAPAGPALLAGPGKVAQALAVDRAWTGHPFHEAGGLELLYGDPPEAILRGPRVGIDFAKEEDRERPWRFACAESRWVSRRKLLGP